ncbi:MAG TPA: hypothetical protein PLI95_29550, partial [Polyangiaceae bacterium]|nr:hypothetical protein [Polyangiaceae bacterium]
SSSPQRLVRFAARCARVSALAVVVVSSCDEDDPAKDIDACIEESIAQGRTANWTQGVWRIEGSGERRSCTDEALNTDEFELGSKAIRVHQQGHYLFLENPSLHPGFSLSGRVGDRCIHIYTSEETPYGTVRYDLPARFLGSSSFSGELRSSGPRGCEGSGEFSVSVRLDPVPPSAVTPAPADAGVTDEMLCLSCRNGCDHVEPEYVAECKAGCEQLVCGKKPTDAGADIDAAESGVPADAADDAEDGDASDDAATDGSEGDAWDDAADDADDDASDDAATDGSVDDAADDVADDGAADVEGDGAFDGGVEDATPDASEPAYALWDGVVELPDPGDLKSGACAVGSGRGATGPGAAWLLVAAALAGWRRRRGAS